MDQEFRRLPLNVIPLVEEMWDIQERDGHCEIRTGQRPRGGVGGGGDDDDDDDVQAYMCVSRS